MIFQILLVTFAVFALFHSYRQFRAERVSKWWMTIWSIGWLLVIAVAITPESTDIVAKFVGVGRGADLLVYLALVLLFYVNYRIMVKQESLRKEITNLTREIAIRDAKRPE